MLKTQIIGHLGQDAELKNLDSGQRIIKFSMANAHHYKDKNGEAHERTTWVNCTKWLQDTDTGKVSQYMLKGNLVYVEGEISARGFVQEGEAKANLELRVSQIELLGKAAEMVGQDNLPF